jgi:hypothetical protein
MKQFSTIIAFNIILLFCVCPGCGKKNSNLPDDIVYKVFSPDTSFTSIRTWEYDGGWTFPVPSDTSAGMTVDFDRDGMKDIGINIGTFGQFVSASNPEANIDYSSGLSPLHDGDAIACESAFAPKARQFVKDSEISDASSYYSFGVTYGEGVSTFDVQPPEGDAYYGFKLHRDGGYRYGWVLLSIDPTNKILTVKEYAINRTLNNPIRAGQIK